MKPLFSIIHPSARPDKWREIYNAWMLNAATPSEVEYVLVVDPRWGFSMDPDAYKTELDNVRVVVNAKRRCYVDAVNEGAAEATGEVLIVIADDQYPCNAWDVELSGVPYPKPHNIEDCRRAAKAPYVIEVATGTTAEHERGIIVMPILSRARYEQQGNCVFYPGYESMFADNDFCEWARKDGVIVDARHLYFEHRHWLMKTREADAVDEVQNRPEAYALGHAMLQRRRASGFTPVSARRTIARCITGENFRGEWLDAHDHLTATLYDLDFEIMRIRSYTSNVYHTREGVRRVIENAPEKPELLLWHDDDNPVDGNVFRRLLAHLDAHMEVDGVAGWCWIHKEDKTGFYPSCGEWSADGIHWNPFPPSFANESQVREFEAGGFPVILMRYSAIQKANGVHIDASPDGAFMPVVDNRLEFGMSGEDMAFFMRAQKGGAKFLVDPQCRVPHMKWCSVEPVIPAEGKVPVKVACMMRVKNEARWIKRAIESVKPLCGEHIYVMEDGSTDDTRAIAESAGAVVLDSPFVGQGLDERRDKNWLLAEVKARCSPDWILMPDGDEELEPGGCEKIRKAVEANPPCDAFALRFLYLWDEVDQARFDGVYGTMLRQSLFRASNNLSFKSYYEKDGENHNHVGLHVSNAPGLGSLRVMPLNVFLLHYGYLHREDRIRKYEWILSIDPNNEQEDFYRHSVQGDIPEVPADAKLKHGGPLELRKLPARYVPQFEDGVPGPRVDAAEEVAV